VITFGGDEGALTAKMITGPEGDHLSTVRAGVHLGWSPWVALAHAS
jgi:hypothetical protein